MADVATDLTALYSPTPVPAPLGEGYKQTPTYSGGFDPTVEAMTKSLSGADPTAPIPSLPIGSGVPMFAAEDISNVGGVTGAAPVEDTATVIPQLATEKAVEDAYEGQISEFHTAETEGITTASGRKLEGRDAARAVKERDRQTDRYKRQGRTYDEETGEWSKKAKRGSDERLTGSDKRRTRRAQRRQRKDAWQTYKGESDLAKTEEAAQLELL